MRIIIALLLSSAFFLAQAEEQYSSFNILKHSKLALDSNIAPAIAEIERVKTQEDNIDSYAKAYYMLCKELWIKDEYALIMALLHDILEDQRFDKHNIAKARLLNFYANAALRTNQYQVALDSYKKSVELFSKEEENQQVGVILVNICVAYEELGQYDEALYYGLKALNIAKQYEEDIVLLSKVYTNLGNVYSSLGIKDTALSYYRKSINFDKSVGDSSGVSYGYSNIGWLYYELQKKDSALHYFFKSVVLDSLHGSRYEQMISRHNYGSILFELNKNMASDNLLWSYELAKDLGNLEYIRKNALLLGEWYAKDGANEAALSFYKELYPLYDSVYTLQKAQDLNQTLKSYDIYKKSLENEVLKRRSAERQRELDLNQTYILSALAIAALLAAILIIVVFSWRNILSKSKALSRKNKLIRQQKETVEHLYEENQELSSILVHDLRAPFAQIQTLRELLEITENPKDKGEILVLIEQATKNGLVLVNDLMHISELANHGAQVSIEKINIPGGFSGTFQHYEAAAKKKGIAFSTSCDPDNFQIESDVNLLRIILDNLISNAVKYTRTGGLVQVVFSQFSDSFKVSINDTGLGFSEEDKEDLYKKFSKLSARPTGNETSTGLGLAIVKRYVGKLGGTIELESELNKGSCFTLTFPLKMKISNS